MYFVFNKIFIFMTIMCFVGACNAREISQELLVFTTPEKEGVFTQYQREVFQEISARAGIQFTLEELPKKRALKMANLGIYAGVAARVQGLDLEYTNLKMIGVSHFSVQHIVFAKNKSIIEQVQDIESLVKHVTTTGYLIGFLRGSKKARRLLSGVPKENLYPLNSAEQGFKMLEIGRIGTYLAGPGIVSRALLKEKFPLSNIQEVSVLSETPLFPYLHIKHAAMIPIFEAVLQSMTDDGTLKQLRTLFE